MAEPAECGYRIPLENLLRKHPSSGERKKATPLCPLPGGIAVANRAGGTAANRTA